MCNFYNYQSKAQSSRNYKRSRLSSNILVHGSSNSHLLSFDRFDSWFELLQLVRYLLWEIFSDLFLEVFSDGFRLKQLHQLSIKRIHLLVTLRFFRICVYRYLFIWITTDIIMATDTCGCLAFLLFSLCAVKQQRFLTATSVRPP